MGNVLNFFAASCISQCYVNEEDKIYHQRLEELEDGGIFQRRKTTLGIISSSENIRLWVEAAQESPGGQKRIATKIKWYALPHGMKSEVVHPELKNVKEILVTQIKQVVPEDEGRLRIINLNNETMLDLKATNCENRDKWLASLQLVIFPNSSGMCDSEKRSGSERSFEKKGYWIKRQSELMEKKHAAEDKKKRLGLTGMKYTAIAMSNRGTL